MDLSHGIRSNFANALTSLVITFGYGIWTMLTLTKSILVARKRGRLPEMTIGSRGLEAVRAHLHALFGFHLTKNPCGLTSNLKGFISSWLFEIPILSLKDYLLFLADYRS